MHALGPDRSQGLFLFRETARLAGGLVVSMHANNRFFHYQFNRTADGKFANPQGKVIGTLSDLVAYYKVYKYCGALCFS